VTCALPDETPDVPEVPAADPAKPTIGAYSEAVDAFLAEATWLTGLDAPLKVHAKAIARSLDRQLGTDGVVQSALASSFDKAMHRLYAGRPATPPPPPGLGDPGPMGEQSIFTFTLDGET
jgi:hypothetical protein